MNFAIIAAGDGTRLAAEGVKQPKPLIPLNGVPMIDRLLRLFVEQGASSISIIVNEQNKATIAYLQRVKLPVPLHLVIQSTPSSMHSLYALKPFLQDTEFCLTTVDTIFYGSEFAAYIAAFRQQKNIDGLMGVTGFVDDEKPLYIQTREDNQIVNFFDTKTSDCAYVSGGIYCLRPAALNVLEQAMQSGLTHMRNFQRQLIRDGLRIKAFPFSKIIDVDHAADIAQAEAFLRHGNES